MEGAPLKAAHLAVSFSSGRSMSLMPEGAESYALMSVFGFLDRTRLPA